jgi:polysaccharide biosynthesis/export protein
MTLAAETRCVRTVLAILAVALALGGCAGDSERLSANVVRAPEGLPAPDLAAVNAVQPDYVITSGDVVEVQVMDAATLNRTSQVTQSGMLTLPMIGDVPAAGSTTAQLRELVASKLRQKYMQDPQVSVLVKETRPRMYTVEGEVTQSGVFPMAGKTSLLQAIATARGVTNVGNPRQVVLFRTIDGTRVAGVFDLVEIRTGKAPDPPIYPNDVVVVTGSQQRRTLREIIGAAPIVSVLLLLQ